MKYKYIYIESLISIVYRYIYIYINIYIYIYIYIYRISKPTRPHVLATLCAGLCYIRHRNGILWSPKQQGVSRKKLQKSFISRFFRLFSTFFRLADHILEEKINSKTYFWRENGPLRSDFRNSDQKLPLRKSVVPFKTRYSKISYFQILFSNDFHNYMKNIKLAPKITFAKRTLKSDAFLESVSNKHPKK